MGMHVWLLLYSAQCTLQLEEIKQLAKDIGCSIADIGMQ